MKKHTKLACPFPSNRKALKMKNYLWSCPDCSRVYCYVFEDSIGGTLPMNFYGWQLMFDLNSNGALIPVKLTKDNS